MNNKLSKKKKATFSQKKDYTIKSLKDVNCFLCNLNTTIRSVKIFKWFN